MFLSIFCNDSELNYLIRIKNNFTEYLKPKKILSKIKIITFDKIKNIHMMCVNHSSNIGIEIKNAQHRHLFNLVI